MAKKKVAIFDIDGTIFRSSLMIELVDELIDEGLFPKRARNTYRAAHIQWLDRKGSYDDYIMAVVKAFMRNITGVRFDKYIAVARRVIEIHKDRTYRYTRDLVQELKKKDYYLLAISNSPKDILDFFCSQYGFDKVYGRMYEVGVKDTFTGALITPKLVQDKAKLLQRTLLKENLVLSGSIGVGDSEADIPFLKLVDRPICFNPNRKLYTYARKNGWEIVVERKDMLYKL